MMLILISLALGMVSCSKDNTITQVGHVTDEQALKTQVAQNDTAITQFSGSDEVSIDDDGMKNPEYEATAGIMADDVKLGKVSADSIYPVRWGRHLDWRHIVRDFHVVIDGDTAWVTITKSIPGDFRVGWGIRRPDTTIVDTVIHKPFTEVVKRIVRFKRVAHTDDPFKNWQPVAITMVDGKTENVNKFTIVSLELSDSQNPPFDATYTDPLNTWFALSLRHTTMPVFPVDDTVKVRVIITSSDSSAEIMHLRHGIGAGRLERRRSLMHLVSTTGGPGNYTRIYERSFRTRLPNWKWAVLAARFNVVVDVISRGSVYDMAAPFSNEFWGAPYIVIR